MNGDAMKQSTPSPGKANFTIMSPISVHEHTSWMNRCRVREGVGRTSATGTLRLVGGRTMPSPVSVSAIE
jgi:hypothetical protein